MVKPLGASLSRPPEAPLVVWDSRARRWRERGQLRNPLACGEPSPQPDGHVEVWHD